eukprot:jgi/Chrpa1/12738/Chrysochromulina_OHIO_Genome00005078-RA
MRRAIISDKCFTRCSLCR